MPKASAALTITEERTFSAQLGGRTVAGLAVADAWRGFTMYANAAGAHLIVLDAEQRVVTGTPALLSTLGLLSNEHFVLIPKTTLPGGLVVEAFWYARYPASKDAVGKLVHDISSKPWVNVNFEQAGTAAVEAGMQVARETQELAVRHLICLQPENWTSGNVGEGTVYQGLRRGTVSSAQAADHKANDDERNWHVLPGGERVYGVAGNIYTWTHDDVQGDERGLVAGRMKSDSISLTTAPYASKEKGMGYRTDGDCDWSGRALIRGGYWDGGDRAGVFYLGYSVPRDSLDFVGFRCTKPA
ncbi:hypothetical protein [Duganella sp. BJB476]|uniref:hypothetical protein n=1 Tax=Duganella sp. BJB476 TaxID=1871176 RepID=UPI000E351C25|nr:hypothetical protein [Duganella sp. BJB476]RFP32453.1 hypothetical protein D0T21_09645 [Duganella sp. BJB476]